MIRVVVSGTGNMGAPALAAGEEPGEMVGGGVGDALGEHYVAKRVMIRRQEHYSKPAPDQLIDEMAKEVDVVIAGLGG